jgi:hypothetical protein
MFGAGQLCSWCAALIATLGFGAAVARGQRVDATDDIWAPVPRGPVAPVVHLSPEQAWSEQPACQSACGVCDACDPCRWLNLRDAWENTLVFVAADGWRARLDDDDSNNFGFRSGFNTGIGWGDCRVRMQVGASYAGYDINGRDAAARTSTDAVEEQVFATAGIYKRSNVCEGDFLSWGVVVDGMYDDHLGEAAQEVKLLQMRFATGWAVSESDEIGVWGTFRTNRENYLTDVSGVICVNSLDQASIFWHRVWQYGADTTAYAGWAEDPGEWVFGLSGQAPLADSLALFGTAMFIVPSAQAGDSAAREEYSEEYWNVSFGLVWYPGFKAVSPNVSGHPGLPLLPVADNGTFVVDAPVDNL